MTVVYGAEPLTSDSTGLPQVSDIEASTHEGIILVSWKAPDQPVSGYMIDYAHDGHHYHWKETRHTNVTLNGGLHMKHGWKEGDACSSVRNELNCLFFLTDLLDKTPYDITVTPLFDDQTGHGSQVLQICSRIGGKSLS